MQDILSSDFFVLRTPLLPFDEVAAFSEGLEAAAICENPAALGLAIFGATSLLRRKRT